MSGRMPPRLRKNDLGERVETTPGRVLVVDDDPSTLRTLARLLKLNGYECSTASSADEARAVMSQDHVTLVLSDVDMPGESGIDLLESLVAQHPDTATVMVTGIDDRELAERALRLGAYGYVIKPFETNEILINISNALRRRQLEIENREHRERLEAKVRERTGHLWNALRELEQAQEGLRVSHGRMIERLALAAEFRDMETVGHLRRMTRYVELLAQRAGMEEGEIQTLRVAALMHDVGKAGVPSEILLKPGKLTEAEFERVKEHARIGARLLADDSSELLKLAARIAETHHEWVDGTGYPEGLKGSAIPLEARIVAIADAFDALTSNRPFRRAYHLGQAVEIMESEAGTHFDKKLLGTFLDAMDEVVSIKNSEDL